ncbi:phosphomevalonate kinase [Aquibacillus saliphilus]|uniref:phosphomevalonate kinase n=1 Tax=Aquibacillus saliphilus TaxID=1909422 RepID=UPI001CF05D06|nr:phosphomevalonate kinase [Aquibacillus saliphilus]
MPNSNYQISVPGKLFIAGEYAVLEPGHQAVVIAVDRYITATIKNRSEGNKLSLPQLGLLDVTWSGYGGKANYSVSDQRLRFIQNTISLVDQYLQEKSVELRPFELNVTSELDDKDSGRKYGLGSSAAVVVGVVTAMLHYYSEKKSHISTELIFKLSAIAHLRTQGSGSGADIAASVFGGWIKYSSFQPDWIFNQLKQGVSIGELIEKPWPKLLIDKITPPKQLNLCVGWTRTAAATAPMINKIKGLRDLSPTLYSKFLQESSTAVANLVRGFEEDDCLVAIDSLKENRDALIKLSDVADGTIETPMLTKLVLVAEKYGSGKSSGAGGGDCGVAFVKGNSQVEQLHSAWKQATILPLDLTVSQSGASVVDTKTV